MQFELQPDMAVKSYQILHATKSLSYHSSQPSDDVSNISVFQTTKSNNEYMGWQCYHDHFHVTQLKIICIYKVLIPKEKLNS